jgi:hypothetical protein
MKEMAGLRSVFFLKKKTKKGKVFPSMMTKEIRRKSKL